MEVAESDGVKATKGGCLLLRRIGGKMEFGMDGWDGNRWDGKCRVQLGSDS